MNIFSALLETLAAGFKLLGEHEANKYRDELAAIKKEYYAEKSKPSPNMAELDNLEFRLFVLSCTFTARASEAQGQTPSVSPGQASTVL